MISLKENYKKASEWLNKYVGEDLPIKRKTLLGATFICAAMGLGVTVAISSNLKHYVHQNFMVPISQVFDLN